MPQNIRTSVGVKFLRFIYIGDRNCRKNAGQKRGDIVTMLTLTPWAIRKCIIERQITAEIKSIDSSCLGWFTKVLIIFVRV